MPRKKGQKIKAAPEQAETEEPEGEEQKQEEEQKLPLDALHLRDAVMELNTSRRSVGLYPPGHAMISGSIGRAFELLQKLFKLRSSITMGITRDTLFIDEHTLAKSNPAFAECALSFHRKGIASVTFMKGLKQEELVALHEILTAEDSEVIEDLEEMAREKGMTHLVLTPVDLGSFKFVEGTVRPEGIEVDVWEDYVHGLLDGRLAGDGAEDGEGLLVNVPPESIAEILNDAMDKEPDDKACDRVIGQYVRRKGDIKLSSESFNKLLLLINKLSPTLRSKFVQRTTEQIGAEPVEFEKLMQELTPSNFQTVVDVFSGHSSAMPSTLKRVIEKLSTLRTDKKFDFDMSAEGSSVLDDIEIGADVISLFDEKPFEDFVSADYRENLWNVLQKVDDKRSAEFDMLLSDLQPRAVEHAAAEIMLEVIESAMVFREDYMKVLTHLTEASDRFLEAGRFEEVLNIYNVIYAQSFSGNFRHEAASTAEYYFRSEKFMDKVLLAARASGRTNRAEFARLARGLKAHITEMMFDALAREQNTGIRKHLLEVLSGFGQSIIPEAVRRLKDKRWYVVRNMIYLIRKCGDKSHAVYVRKYAKHPYSRVCGEALSALLEFKTRDAVPFLKLHLRSGKEKLRLQAAQLAGSHKVKAAVPQLIELVGQKDALGAEAADKAPYVRALGRIGDQRALGRFEMIMNSSAVLYQRGLEELKVEVLRSLENFPRREVNRLLSLGLQSGSTVVRAEAARLAATKYARGAR